MKRIKRYCERDARLWIEQLMPAAAVVVAPAAVLICRVTYCSLKTTTAAAAAATTTREREATSTDSELRRPINVAVSSLRA